MAYYFSAKLIIIAVIAIAGIITALVRKRHTR